MVVVTARREKGGSVADALRDLEAENIAIEDQGAVDVGDLEVDVADACLWMNGWHGDWIRHSGETMPQSIVVEV